MSLLNGLLFIAATVGPSLLVSWLCCFGIRRWAPRFGLVDKPGGRKDHERVTPLGGGVGVWFGMTLSFAAGICALLILRNQPQLQELVPDFARPHLPGVFSRIGELLVVLVGGTSLMFLGLL